MGCNIEFKSGTFEITESTRQCLAQELEIWEAKKIMREIGLLPVSNVESFKAETQNDLFDIINKEMVLNSLYPSGDCYNSLSITSIIKRENIMIEVLKNLHKKMEKGQGLVAEKIKELC